MTSVATPATRPPAALSTALALLRADAPSTITGAPEEWPRWAVLLPHVLAATHQLTTIDTEPTGQHDATAWDDCSWLLDRAGTYLQVHGRFTESQLLLERALTITEAVHGPDHPTVATSLGNLALVLRDLGQDEQARPLLERALTIGEAVHGPDHPTVAISPWYCRLWDNPNKPDPWPNAP
jgi:hypothetical protein